MNDEEVKRIIEALLFVSERPLGVDRIKEVLEDVDTKTIKSQILELKKEYEEEKRSFGVHEVANGYQLSTDSAYGPWLKKMLKKSQSKKLSSPSLETLAIIAYRQPITRSEIEFIRGVNVDGVLRNLFERGLIRITGRKQTVGRPILYGTTREFLEHFGLNSLDELPKLEEFHEAAPDSIEIPDKSMPN